MNLLMRLSERRSMGILPTLRRNWCLILGVTATLAIWGVALTSIHVHEPVEGVYSIETDTW